MFSGDTDSLLRACKSDRLASVGSFLMLAIFICCIVCTTSNEPGLVTQVKGTAIAFPANSPIGDTHKL